MSVCHPNNKSVCLWHSENKIGIVIKKKGNYMKGMGYHKNKKFCLHPEEVLFLLDRGAMFVYQNKVEFESMKDNDILDYINNNDVQPLELQHAYSNIISDELPLYIYQVYSHLKRLGYILVRNDFEILRKQINIEIATKNKLNILKKRPIPASRLFGFDAIFKKLKKVDSIELSYFDQNIKLDCLPQYQIFQPNYKFKATDPGACYRQLLIVRMDDDRCTPSNLSILSEQFDSTPIIIGIVDQSSIMFIELESAINTYDKILDIRSHH